MQQIDRFASRRLRAAALAFATAALMAGAAGVTNQADAAEPSPAQLAAHVLNRLSYGPRPGDIERVMQMGVAHYIEQQLDPASTPLPPSLQQQLAAIPVTSRSTGAVLGEFMAARAQAKRDGEAGKEQRRETVAAIVDQTAQARLLRAIDSPRQLEEVMVDFWFNHFNVFAGKGLDRALVAGYERDAIRPYAMGSFRDLLYATARHPAMLFYLDNYLSTAADYQPPQRGVMHVNAGPKAKAAGLNENYARELMELHTLGVDAGYSQQDVTELARMLTGWTFNPSALARQEIGYRFAPQRHDAGDKQWLGQHIGSHGEREGEFALDLLARHPATARHVSFLLAQYFVRDDPPPALVERMAQRYLASQGDIRSVLRTLFFSPEFNAADAVGSKFKTPYRYVISAVRAADVAVTNVRPLLGVLNQLGMPLYGCQTPDGYKNTEAAWLNPEALSRRIAFASGLASGKIPAARGPDAISADAMNPKDARRRAGLGDSVRLVDPPPLDAEALLATLGPAISQRTRETVLHSPKPLRAAMVLGSPDFMRH